MTERQAWGVVLILLCLIYLLIPLGPIVLPRLKAFWGPGFGRWLSAGLLLLGLGLVASLGPYWIRGLFFLAIISGVGSHLRIVEERVHLLEYSLLAFSLHLALSFRLRRGVFWGAFLLAALFGLIDELLQGLYPLRHFDTRDLAINTLSAALGAGLRHATAPRP
ncbi:MAG TPA: VanZ family protein [Thermodesulfatator sp.]|nr:VanZ family protein [Thermodesulfatator sp.]